MSFRREKLKIFSVTIYHPTAFDGVKQRDVLGGAAGPGAQMKALELYFSKLLPNFREDLPVVELFHEARRV